MLDICWLELYDLDGTSIVWRPSTKFSQVNICLAHLVYTYFFPLSSDYGEHLLTTYAHIGMSKPKK